MTLICRLPKQEPEKNNLSLNDQLGLMEVCGCVCVCPVFTE